VLPLISMNRKSFILVTGGCGYIGSHTVVELVKAGYEVVIADDLRNANRQVMNGLNNLLGFQPVIHELDVCDETAMDVLFDQYKFGGIIHFAADKAVGESVQDPLKYYHNNIGGLVVMCKLALKHKVSNFVFSSSCTIYGEPKGLKEVTENSPKSPPSSPYGNTKLIGEQILADVQRAHSELKIMNLRYFNPVGAHPTAEIGEFPLGKPNNLFPFVTQTAIGIHEHLTVFGSDYPTEDGTCIRDYIHVCDLANAHVKALSFLEDQVNPCLEYVNIGTGKGTSILEVINIFERETGRTLNWKFGPRREGDIIEIYANADRSRQILNWTPSYSVADAVKHAWNWEQRIHQNA
jgi:UDP-glucose 4-epimerase